MITLIALSCLFYVLKINSLHDKFGLSYLDRSTSLNYQWKRNKEGSSTLYDSQGNAYKEELFPLSSTFLSFLTNGYSLFEWLEYRCIETTIFILIGNYWGLLIYLLIPIRYYA